MLIYKKKSYRKKKYRYILSYTIFNYEVVY